MNIKRRQSSKTDSAWIRSGAMRAIVSFLEHSGVDPLSVVGREGMRIAEASDPYRKVDLLTVLRAFQSAADITGRPDIGLELGLTQRLEDWGPFVFLFLNAPTVGDAYKDLCRYGAVLQSHARFRLVKNDKDFGISYTSNHPELAGWELDGEISITLLMCIVNNLLDKPIMPKQILFEHLPICELADYRRWLGVTPRFGASINAVIYPQSIAKRRVRNANPELYQVLKRHMRDLTEAEIGEDPILNFVRNNISRGMTQGTATLEHVAAEIGLKPRTLQRRLTEKGTSFQVLFDEVRLSRAKYFLSRSSLSITDIAMELGYAEASVFLRAFKRLTGLLPNEYRREHQI